MLRGRTPVVTVMAAALMLGGIVMTSTSAIAAPRDDRTTKTSTGQRLTVSPARNLSPDSATVRVRGAGFNRSVGIYVALCVMPVKGQQPSPCGGGVNMTANDPSSAWISSTPPPYGRDLAIPYKANGRFSVKLTISSMIGDIDCRVVQCAIVTRADHLRTGDRRFDVAVPVRFAASP